MRCRCMVFFVAALLLIAPSSMALEEAPSQNDRFDYVWAFHNGFAQFEQDGKIGLIDETGTIRLPAEYDEIEPQFKSGVARIRKYHEGENRRKSGLINQEAKVICAPIYTRMNSFSEGRAAVWKDGKCGLIDTQGNVICEPQWYWASEFSDGLIAMCYEKEGKLGYADLNGNVVIEPAWNYANPFHDGLAYVRGGKTDGVIDKQGNFVLKTNKSVKSIEHGVVEYWDYKDDFLWVGLMDFKGKNILKSNKWRVEDSTSFGEEGLRIIFDKKGKCGFINTKGQVVIKPQGIRQGFGYYQFSEGYVVMEVEEGLWHCFDTEGRVQFELACSSMDQFSEGWATFWSKETGCGFVNTKGEIVLEPNFEYGGSNRTTSFNEGLAGLERNDLYGYMDKQGNEVISPRFTLIWPFRDGLAEVEINGQKGYINKQGGIVCGIKE